MDREKRISSQNSNTPRRNRVKRIKTFIIIIAVLFLVLPTILCIFMFFKLNSLQKQIDILMIDRYGATYTGKNETSNEFVAHAATIYNSGLNAASGQNDGKTESDRQPSSESSKLPGAGTDNTKKDAGIEKDNNTEGQNAGKSFDQAGKNTGKPANTGESANTKTNVSDKEVTKTNNTKQNGAKQDSTKQSNTKQDNTKQDEFKDFDKKTVYLTFDDGPSKYTEDLLKVLSDYKVKATFFVIGKTDEHSKKMYKEIVDQGHTLGMHSYSHDYKKIYKSVEDFDKDFTKIRTLLYDTTGYRSSIYRFPGGSSNSVMKEDVSVFINYLNQKSVVYFDWNVVSGDATGVEYTTKQLYENVINGIKLHSRSIVLMHDTDVKQNTIASLKMILKTLTEQGVEILPLNENVTPIQQVKASSIKQKK